MDSHLNTLLANYIDNVTGLLAAVVTDRKNISNVITETGEVSAIELILTFLEKTFDRIYDEYGNEDHYLEIFVIGDKKYSTCSFGNMIITTIAETFATDIELKVYSVHLADKIEMIHRGEKNVSIQIPGILRLFSKSKGDQMPVGNFSLKVVVNGDAESGKSSIIKRFVEDKFVKYLTPTVGFEISKKEIEISENTKINYIIWDTGGLTCRIPPTKEKIYNLADAAIIAIDLTQENYYTSIKRWYDEIIESILYEIPIIIVGTKADLVKNIIPIEIKLKAIAKEFGAQYFSLSAISRNNIKEVFVEIADNIIELINKKKKQETDRTSGNYDKYYINTSEIKALEDLEQVIFENSRTSVSIKISHDLLNLENRGFPKIFNVDETSFGIQILNGHVVGLGLFDCGLVSLPNSFRNLKSLKKLSLRCNPLSSFPEEISTLASLEELDLSLTGLMKIPPSIRNLKSLKILHLENNILSTLPEDFGDLKSLEILFLDNNPIQDLPNRFCLLNNLEKLYMEAPHFFFRASINELPKYFGNLRSLIILDISSHELKTLPESFGYLRSLKILHLYNNKLKYLPDSFGNLINLEILDLESNKLKTLSDTLGDLIKLRKISLTNNLLHKEGSKKFKALAFKASGKEYDRLMNLSELCKAEEEKKYRDFKKPVKRSKINIISMLGYASVIALIGFVTFFLFVDFTNQPSFTPIIWLIFIVALIINILVGSSIIPTISSYIKISILIFQRQIYKIFDIFVVILLIWSIRSVVKAWHDVELIPAVNFLFEFTIPEWFYDILVDIGYNLELTFLENIDLFFGHFFLKIFSTGLVFWALYRNGIGHIKKTAFDEKEKRNIWPFLILGMIGAFSLAIMNYSTLKDYLSISYSIGVCIGACVFIYVKHNNNLKILITYLFIIGLGISLVWILSLWDMIVSLVCGLLFILVFIIIRWRFLKKFLI